MPLKQEIDEIYLTLLLLRCGMEFEDGRDAERIAEMILFSGILFELSGISEKIAYVTISKWSMEALGSICVLNDLPTKLHKTIMTAPIDGKKAFLSVPNHVIIIWVILIGMTIICLILCTLLLRSLSRDGR